MERLYFARDDGKAVGIEFTGEELLLFAGPELKFTHYLRNQQLGMAYSLGGLFAQDYEFIAEFTDLSSVIISTKKYTSLEIKKINRDGITNETINVLRERYPELLFYGRLDPDVKTTQLYGHKEDDQYDGFILDNGCFASLAQGKIQLNSNIKLVNPNRVGGGQFDNEQLISVLLPLSYDQVVEKCKDKKFSKVCDESFWQRYGQRKKYNKTKNTWKETIEYEENKAPIGGKYNQKKGIFSYLSPYSIDNNLTLTAGEKQNLAQRMEEELIAIPEINNSKDLRFGFKDNFELSFNLPDITEKRETEIVDEIDNILLNTDWQIKRNNRLYNIYFE